MDVDVPVNGTAKRKSRSSISSKVNYKDASEDSDDDAPLVSFALLGAFIEISSRG